MKKLSWFNKVIFFFNVLVAIGTLLGYVLPFLAPKLFPLLSVFTLILPSLLLLNFFFLLYWAIQVKKQVALSVVILLLGFTFITKFYKITGKEEATEPEDIVLMTYNVRLFNLFKWIPDEFVPQKIKEFVDLQDPDILCLQEYSKSAGLNFKQYPYKYVVSHGDKIKTGQAIYSKHRIIDKGEINLPNSNNNVIFADVLIQADTIRVYSIHLQSVSISPDIHEKLDEEKSKRIFKRIASAFKEQQMQSELIQSHMKDATHRKVICGDMNNSAFSYVYSNIKGELKDAFIEAGSGFGKSYDFPYYPMRIDYVFVDPSIQVKSFKTYSDFKNSDHFPIVTRLALNER
ncbi:endonuclease/exonuclease/phosphatase family protein [Myroides odoratus]|uniref:endonuclease/exonuclease/phosphatase family protein n=1 Tax=Myroides TaxID=76831 RepID=UPI00216A3145|nr:endonuclease/exonuclease/phosphatase family protein [Myroides odoratus]MCS4240340.1 endonuclease/exonuclease/phosphatase family metal-dependent hydrolase [Myroides odoratus]MDH6601501.1 endonuclease/exonuclease/phosphatase family metal-dependent hydrolase [Myroides gitamensis]